MVTSQEGQFLQLPTTTLGENQVILWFYHKETNAVVAHHLVKEEIIGSYAYNRSSKELMVSAHKGIVFTSTDNIAHHMQHYTAVLEYFYTECEKLSLLLDIDDYLTTNNLH